MTRLYWHAQDRTAELNGSERAWMKTLAAGPADAAWRFDHGRHGLDRAAELLRLVPQEHRNYVHARLPMVLDTDMMNSIVITSGDYDTDEAAITSFKQQLSTTLAVDGYPLLVAGVELHTRNIALNTALRAGSDPVRLAAKIDGWSSQHCWVEGPDRAWLASIIDEGLDHGLYRRGLWIPPVPGAPRSAYVFRLQGWEDVLSLLRSADDGPVVLSYSENGGFTNHTVADWDPHVPADWRPDWATGDGRQEWAAFTDADRADYRAERAAELFDQLPDVEQWDRAVTGLREHRPWGRLSPDSLARVTFGPPVSIYDLYAPDRDQRVARAAAATLD